MFEKNHLEKSHHMTQGYKSSFWWHITWVYKSSHWWHITQTYNHRAGDVNMLLYTINCCQTKLIRKFLTSLIFKRFIFIPLSVMYIQCSKDCTEVNRTDPNSTNNIQTDFFTRKKTIKFNHSKTVSVQSSDYYTITGLYFFPPINLTVAPCISYNHFKY